ncbi:MAG: 2-succinyl-5-enolpyruvyl-6-hydroxy-3-cyclohexene-1-carboxylic-acid synthase [Flavobacteriaceae bacterium]|nr:MAG: 2-succinyl-5-enolpyruvyl-6-hydroxy-3-cyclohexene-1-carboxylic-acid synthase [Flavobacteriaceae bacterium]
MPQFPKNILAQQVIASCVAHNIEHVVISPGSRNAPLTIGFVNHPNIKTYSVVDERSAAFFALGIAQQTKKAVAVVCTSGSALLNYYPAVAEAFYSDIPLVVISSDRPKHLIDIGDGQTVRQEKVFKNHILASANLIEEADNLDTLSNILKTAIRKNGPVHINVPFDEPLYEIVDSILEINVVDTSFEETPLDVDELQKYATIWNNSKKKMVLIGSNAPSELLQVQFNKIMQDPSVIVLTETISNVHHTDFINNIDQTIFSLTDAELDELRPDILVTLGGMIVSKKIKQYLRKFQPKHHWHVDAKKAFDTYFCLERHFEITPELFFSQFFFLTPKTFPSYLDYQQKWIDLKSQRKIKHTEYLNACEYSDLKVFETVLDSIPNHTELQLGNSSIIRYSQLFDVNFGSKVFCNRGTSGIDGSTSTAIGASVVCEDQTVFITGDISFFYDSNALWNSNIKNDFRIILINNNGGGIFKFIPGPQKTNALDYFETPHNLTAKHLCKMFGFEYQQVSDLESVHKSLEDFYSESKQPILLEICTPSSKNDVILKQYFASLK